MLSENEYCMAMLGRETHKTFKEYIFECYENGDSVKEIAKIINKSKTTVYGYIQVIQDKIRYPILKAEIKIALNYGDFKSFVENLVYKDICIIRRKFRLYGVDKKSKIQAILDFFKDFSILGLFPEELTKLKIKLAYRKMSMKTHPDLNKNLDKSGREFQAVYHAYSTLVKIYA